MKVLVACEFSAIVRDAFRERGHAAWSCDLLPTEGDPRWHIQGDVLSILNDGWDMMIAHPPCTYLANSGVRWLYEKPGRWEDMRKGAEFFMRLLNAPISRICVENPVQHKHCNLPRPAQTVQPWQFGDKESKRICLWLKNLPPLKISQSVKPEGVAQRVWRMPPGPDRQKERSRYFKGIAKAKAEQWGAL